MKKHLVLISLLACLLSACNEKPPVIIFHAPTSIDTTYTLAASNIPLPDAHNVLVEEYTGASCTNCPAAHVVLKSLEADHHGRINVIGLYIIGHPKTRQPFGAKYDFRNEIATGIANSIYGGVGILPSGGVDRLKVSGEMKLSPGQWSGIIPDRLDYKDSLNIRVGLSYNPMDNILTIKDTVIYTSPVGYKHNLSIVIVEDSLIDIQEYPSTDPVHPVKDDEYVFMNVFRGMATDALVGDPMLVQLPVKEAGRVIVRVYRYKLANVVNPYHCRVISFVNGAEPGDSHVLQSVGAEVN